MPSRIMAATALLVIAWIAIITLLIKFRAPYIDEGYYTFGPYNLISSGRLDARQIEPSAFVHPNIDKPMTRIDRRAYFHMPLEMLLQAGWYKLFGWGLSQQRLLSTLLGLIGLGLWFALIRRWSDPATAGIALVLIAFDWIYLTAASFGRMDMMAHTFGLAALYFHERYYASRPLTARALSAGFLSAAALVHPNGFFVWGAVYAARSFSQWRSWKPREIPAFALPAIIAAGALAWWIAYDPVAFHDQMMVNSAFRFTSFQWNELIRYAAMYGVIHPHSREIIKAFIPITFGAGFFLAGWYRAAQARGFSLCLSLGVTAVVSLAFFDGTKWGAFGLHTAPWLAAIAAFGFRAAWTHGKKMLTLGWLSVYLAIPCLAAVAEVRQNTLGNLYLPAVAALENLHVENSVVFAPPEFIFGYRGPMLYDVRLGYISHRRPPAIVIDHEHRQGTLEWAQTHNVKLHDHILHVLEKECTPVFSNSKYAVYSCG